MPRLTLVHPGAPRPPVRWNASLATARPGLGLLREWLKLAARAGLNYRTTRVWLAYWNSSSFLAELASVQPGVVKKIYRPYLFRQLDCRQRLAVLTAHYDFVTAHRIDKLVLRAAKAPVLLTEFAGKSGRPYRLELVAVHTMEREGELVLQMTVGDIVLFSVAFSFLSVAGVPHIGVGCLQGGRSADALEQIRLATRDLFGLRPKTLLMRVLQQIGHAVGCGNLLLVGNGNRVMLQQIRKGRVSADYDSSWRELGAQLAHDGNFVLPCTPLALPDFALLASNKRSEAKKRHALLAAIAELSCTALAPGRMQAAASPATAYSGAPASRGILAAVA